MESELRAGAHIDVVSPEDLRTILNEMLEDLRDVREPASIFDVEIPVVANAAGVLALVELFDIPTSYACTIHRIHVNAAGATPLAPLATGYIFFSRNDDSPMNMFFFIPGSGTTVAPVVASSGGDESRFIRGGSRIMAYGAGLPANQRLYLTLQIKLEKWDDR